MAESLIVNDGQYNWTRGMDSSRSPMASDPNSVRVAINVTFRGGRAKTRPGFQQVFLTDDPDYPGSLALFATGVWNGQKTGNLFQGAFFYVNKSNPTKSCIIAVSGGYVFRIRPVEGYVARLNIKHNPGLTSYKSIYVPNPPVFADGLFRIDGTRKVYFCQAEKFLIIQNGVDRPVVWDGDGLFQTGVGSNTQDPGADNQLSASMPIGTYMAYGQGRLFIASPTKDSFYAGDIVFGGSSEQFDIAASFAGAQAVISTGTVPHGFSSGDVVSISGHSATPNINGTWRVYGTNATQFSIPTGLAAGGVGGYVTKAAAGADTDLLRFIETTYLAEGGAFSIPAQMGQIRGLAFMPVMDTGTGQGDLLVFGEQGVASFNVSMPRDLWKTTPAFQRVALSNIGLVSDRTLIPINNDLYFRSIDGIRNYRNARAQQDGYNVTPISTEMDAIMDFDTEGLLESSSAVYFDNRLLFTVSPRENYENIGTESLKYRSTSFQGIGVLDFNSLGTSGEKQPAIFDGVWTGCESLQLLTGVTNRLPRCFIFSYDPASNSNQLWENYPWALFDYPLGQSARKIQAALETRAYDFDTPWNLKKLERGDMWIGELSGDTKVNVYFRPDENPCWFPWHTFDTCSELESCISPVAVATSVSGFETVRASGKTVERATTWKLSFKDEKPFRIRIQNSSSSRVGHLPTLTSGGTLLAGAATTLQPKSGGYLNTLTERYTPVVSWPPTAASIEAAINSAFWVWVPAVDGTFTSGTYKFLRASVSQLSLSSTNEFLVTFKLFDAVVNATTNSITPGADISNVALEAPSVLVASEDCGVYKPLNLKDQYRSQLRLPTPGNDCVTSTGSLARVGHNFQFRYEWEGQFSLTKIMFHASKLVEPVGGACL